jgi:GH18 family chitinase
MLCLGLAVSVLSSLASADDNGNAHDVDPRPTFRRLVYLSGGHYPNEAAALASHIDHVTDINFAFLNPTNDGSGNIAPMGEQQQRSLNHLMQLAKEHDKKVFLAFGGWRGSDSGQDIAYERIAASPAARRHFIDEILKLIDRYDVDGIDLDWEYPRLNTPEHSYAQDYADLVQELATALHARGKELSAAVIGVKDKPTDDGDGAAYLDSVLVDLDLVNLMAYDNSDGDHSPLELSHQSLAYWIDDRGLDPRKAVLGIPLYARPGWIDYNKIVEKYGEGQSQRDTYVDLQTDTTGYYNGIPTVIKKTHLAWERNLGGIMFWELPLDTFGTQTDLSLIKAAHDQILSTSTNNAKRSPSR